MSTRGSIVIDRQSYRREAETGQHPHAVADPRIADDVGLNGEHEDRTESGRDRGDASRDQSPEEREAPGDPKERAEEARLDADLGVVRLPGLDRRARPRR